MFFFGETVRRPTLKGSQLDERSLLTSLTRVMIEIPAGETTRQGVYFNRLRHYERSEAIQKKIYDFFKKPWLIFGSQFICEREPNQSSKLIIALAIISLTKL